MSAPLVRYSKLYANSPTFYHNVRIGYRQPPPYNLPSPCEIERKFGSGTDVRSWSWGSSGKLDKAGDPNMEQMVTNRSYEKFVAKLGDSSQFGSTLTAEGKQTAALVTGTVLRMLLAAKKVIRFNFKGAAKILGLPYTEKTITTFKWVKRGKRGRRKAIKIRRRVFQLPTGRMVQKTLANGWLMYSYGIKPLTEDIYNGMDILQRPIPIGEKIRVTARGKSVKTIYTRPPTHYYSARKYSAEVRVSCGAFVTVENPNLWLLNKMGLINPVQWFNEGIPFSFVIDWFSNLSSVIGSLTDFAGLSILHRWTSKKIVASEDYFFTSPYDTQDWNKTRVLLLRGLSLPTPKLVFSYERPNWQRGLNAISLLIGLLPKK